MMSVQSTVITIVLIAFWWSTINQASALATPGTSAAFLGDGREVCLSLKPRSRPARHSSVNIRKVLERCRNIHAAASCLLYLDRNESDYMVAPETSRGKAFGDEDWPPMPECPKPVHLRASSLAPMLYHTFSSGNTHDRIDLMVNSFLFTQPLGECVLAVWFASESEMVEYKKHFGKRSAAHVSIRHFAYTAKLQALQSALVGEHSEKSTMALSDQVRMILLLEYGGLWIDLDTVMLRDMSPLWPFEFAGRWSYEKWHNTAVFRLFSGSRTGQLLWDRAVATGEVSFLPRTLLTLLEGTGSQLLSLPSPIVDPAWLTTDKILQDPDDAFAFHQKRSFFAEQISLLAQQEGRPPCVNGHMHFFDGAFLYHWGGDADNQKPAIVGTYFHAIQRIQTDFIEGKTANIYGDMFVR